MKCPECARLRAQIKRLQSENSHLRAGGEAAIQILSFQHGALLPSQALPRERPQGKLAKNERGAHELHGMHQAASPSQTA
jgi:hypothetical protein